MSRLSRDEIWERLRQWHEDWPFQIVQSYATSQRYAAKSDHLNGMIHMALIEYVPGIKRPNKQHIDPRLKCIRQIVLYEHSVPRKGKHYWTFWNTFGHMVDLGWKFNKLYPLHFLSKEWPLPWIIPPWKVKNRQ